jgi:hypothetical protein
LHQFHRVTYPSHTSEKRSCVCFYLHQVRCKTGSPSNNGRPLLMSDLIYARPYQVKDNFGRDWPGEWVPMPGTALRAVDQHPALVASG